MDSPKGLNAVQDYVLNSVPANAQCVVILGGGDGRLGRAIRKKYPKANIYSFEPETRLHKYYDKSEALFSNPWDVDKIYALAKQHNGIDCLILQNVHEYWRGNVRALQKIFELMKNTGVGFFSFYNSATLFELGRQIPPFVVGASRLANPFDLWPRMDLTSWLIYFSDVGVEINEVWGLLQENALAYCSKQTDQQGEEKWETKGLSVQVKDTGDAFISGAPVVCLKFALNTEGKPLESIRFLAIPLSASMMQAILIPNDNELSQEMKVLQAESDAFAYEHQKEDSSNLFIDLFVQSLDDFKDVKRVLVIGCGWGADMLALQKLKPEWEIVGADASNDIVEIGKRITANSKVEIVKIDKGRALPFKDGEFDLVISLRHFSVIYSNYARHLAKELLRVSKQGVAHLEDFRGPKVSMDLKPAPVLNIYEDLGKTVTTMPLKIQDEMMGMYILKVKNES